MNKTEVSLLEMGACIIKCELLSARTLNDKSGKVDKALDKTVIVWRVRWCLKQGESEKWKQ